MAATVHAYRIHTLGCRVNHAETRDLEVVLQRHGLHRARTDQPAAVEVIHSCAVTSRAAAKSRNAARRAVRRQNLDHGLVLITGCLPGIGDTRDAAAAAGGADRLIGHGDPSGQQQDMIHRFEARLLDWLQSAPAGHHAPGAHGTSTHALPVVQPHGDRPNGHIRAELKIQDGCDAHCTFCIIPTLRPMLRSKPVRDVVNEARQLIDAGHVEIVLTGIFIGAYGHETALRRKQANRHASPLADLLDAVAQVPGLQRLRLSSMEPGDLDEPLLDAMLAHDDIIVPHLHLPLQSGSDPILRRMNRQYDTAAYRDMLAMANEALTTSAGLPPALTTDIICGFPGETDADFQATVDMAQHAEFLHMHVFPYSARPGTAAARWTKQAVPGTIARARVGTLIDLESRAGGLSDRYRTRLLNRPTRVILEQPDASRPGPPTHWLGRCDRYALLSIQTDESAQAGHLLQAIPHRIEDDVLLATACPRSVGLPVVQEGHTACIPTT